VTAGFTLTFRRNQLNLHPPSDKKDGGETPSWADSEGMKMNDGANMSMMLGSGQEPSEQDKVERPDGPIAGFISAGGDVRIC
jgi:hypothetical protein